MEPTPKKSPRFLLPSLPDAMAVAGLVLLGYGIHLYSTALCWSVVGALLLVGGLLGHLTAKRGPTDAA
ncbi:MAG: hypothetical protein ACOY8P_07970 [Thermodesulfobacteriota bacterium]|jgi:fatty acid desaturase